MATPSVDPVGTGPTRQPSCEPSETRVTLVLLRVLYSSTPFIGRVLPMNPAPAGATRVVEALMKLGPDEGGI